MATSLRMRINSAITLAKRFSLLSVRWTRHNGNDATASGFQRLRTKDVYRTFKNRGRPGIGQSHWMKLKLEAAVNKLGFHRLLVCMHESKAINQKATEIEHEWHSATDIYFSSTPRAIRRARSHEQMPLFTLTWPGAGTMSESMYSSTRSPISLQSSQQHIPL